MRCGRWLVIASTRSWCAGAWFRHWRRARPRTRRAARPRPHRSARRREDAPAVDEQLGEAGVRPRILGARDRMRRHEMHMLGRCGSISATTAPLTEPTSETIAPGLRRARSARRSRRWRRPGCRGSRNRRSATARAIRRDDVAKASALARSSTPSERSARTIAAPRAARRAARAIDEPISPTPMIASRSKIGSASGSWSRSATLPA